MGCKGTRRLTIIRPRTRVPRLVRGDPVRRELGTHAGGVLQEVEADLPLEEPGLGAERDPVLGVDGEEDGAEVDVVPVFFPSPSSMVISSAHPISLPLDAPRPSH